MHNNFIPRPRCHRILIVLGFSLCLAACAPFPKLGEFEPKEITGYQASASLDAPVRDWPIEAWWRVYPDSQLDALIEEALRNSPDMLIATARLHNAEAVSQITGAARLPQINANASITGEKTSYNYLFPRDMAPHGLKDYGRLTLDFSWEIDFWGKNRAALAAATSELAAREADLAQARLTLSTAIAADYAELARLYSSRDTAARSVEVRSKTAALFAERFANGLETRGSVRQADAVRAAAEGEVLLIDEQIGLQRNRLAALVGAGPDRGLAIKRPTVNIDRAFALPRELAANLLGRRPDIVSSRLQVEAQLHRIDQKKAEFYPNVNLSAFVGFYSLGLDKLFKDGSDIAGVGPAISLPIFTGGRLQGQLRGARANYDEAVANYDRTVTQALQEVADAALSRKALTGRLAKSEEAVAAASEAHRIANNRYEGGLSGYLEVLSAEDTLLTNLSALTDLRSRALILDVALVKALGGGYQSEDNNSIRGK